MGRHPIDWHPHDRLRQPERQDGKTTATINSAAALATRNHDVLAIDMDPQADMTKGRTWSGDDNDPSSPKNELPSIGHR